MTTTGTEAEVWRGAGVQVDCRTRLDDRAVTALWEVYWAAFEPLRTRAAARHVLTRSEFVADMVDPRIWKYVAVDEDQTPVGLALTTTHLEVVPWISPEYYAVRFPDAWARRALYYVPFVCTDPRATRTGVYAVIYRAFMSRPARERGVLAYDICTSNIDTLRLDVRMADWHRRSGARTVDRVDSQHYYAADFGEGRQ